MVTNLHLSDGLCCNYTIYMIRYNRDFSYLLTGIFSTVQRTQRVEVSVDRTVEGKSALTSLGGTHQNAEDYSCNQIVNINKKFI